MNGPSVSPGAFPKTILIICLRRIGDVLLTTALARSCKVAWPDARIEWIVFEGTQGILENNPACDAVHLVQHGTGIFQFIGEYWTKFRFFDVAISAQSGDRPTLMARWLAREAYGLASDAVGGRSRDWIMSAVGRPSRRLHRIDQILSLCGLLGIRPIRYVTPPSQSPPRQLTLPPRYWVLHPGAAFVYKQWNRQGWRELCAHVVERGCQIVVTGGRDPSEKAYLDELFQGLPVIRLDGKLTWPELVYVLNQAERFVGVDTSVSHLAASIGAKCHVIFGPTNPALWAPLSPCNTDHSLSSRLMYPIKVIHHADKPCWPCQLEGCDRHVNSHSACLDELSFESVRHQIEKSET